MNNQDFIDSLIEEHIQWRVTELALIQKIYLKLGTSNEKNFFLQASIPTIYAIWEGFVKNVLKSLLKFLDTKNFQSKKLSQELLVWSLSEKLKNLKQSEDFKKKMKHSKLLLNALESKVKFSNIKIDTKSNLNDRVLKELCLNFGILNIEAFFSDDELDGLFKLVDIRNKIVHGEKNSVIIELKDVQKNIILLSKLMDNWISLIDDFLKNENFYTKD